MILNIKQTRDKETGVVLRTRITLTPECEGEATVLKHAVWDSAVSQTPCEFDLSFDGGHNEQWSTL